MHRPKPDSGFTVIELVWTMLIAFILMAVLIGGYTSYDRAQQQAGSATALVEGLRNAQARAQADGTEMCVRIDVSNGSWTTYRSTCATGTVLAAGRVGSTRVHLNSPAFRQFDGSIAADVRFLARGIATAGSVTVTRDGASKTYRVDVEGLTSRVSMD